MLMYKVGVVGDKDSIMGFLALGIDIFPAYDSDEIKKSIHKLVEDEYAIIYSYSRYWRKYGIRYE